MNMKYFDNFSRLVGAIFLALALTVILSALFGQKAHGQTNMFVAPPMLVAQTPQAVAATVSAWWTLLLLPVGGTIWHIILKLAPWAKANGGLLRGVLRFFWDSAPPIPMYELNPRPDRVLLPPSTPPTLPVKNGTGNAESPQPDAKALMNL